MDGMENDRTTSAEVAWRINNKKNGDKMVKLKVDYNKLWLIVAKRQYQLESATIFKRPNLYEIIVFILDGQKRIRRTFKQKTFEGVPNVIFKQIPCTPTEGFSEKAYSSGSKESPTAINWYINYYNCKE